jgi:hypothetical protein
MAWAQPVEAIINIHAAVFRADPMLWILRGALPRDPNPKITGHQGADCRVAKNHEGEGIIPSRKEFYWILGGLLHCTLSVMEKGYLGKVAWKFKMHIEWQAAARVSSRHSTVGGINSAGRGCDPRIFCVVCLDDV